MTPRSNVDMRWGNCGRTEYEGWRLGWAQLIGEHHSNATEDAVDHLATTTEADCICLAVAVADGVGGGTHPDVASHALASHCVRMPGPLFAKKAYIASWMTLAEPEVQMKLRAVSFDPGASTMVAAWLRPGGGGHAMCVGDARAYLHTAKASTTVTALTQDQTYASVKEVPPCGGSLEDPARMVGTGCMGSPEVLSFRLEAGQTLLLCSDGLHRGMNATQIGCLLAKTADLQDVAMSMARTARELGSTDDISLLLVQNSETLGKKSLRRAARLWNLLKSPI